MEPRSDSEIRRLPWVWAAALGFLVLLDAGITRTPLLWAPTSFENDVGPRMVFSQAYQTARKLYAPRSRADLHVALLGNSRMWLGVREKALLAAMQAEEPTRSLRVDNLSVFGSSPGVMEVIGRHLDQIEPSLVVLGLSGSDLEIPPDRWGDNPVMQLMQRGLADPAYPPSSALDRVDRWLRSVWPLYRFREFARAALVDRVAPTGSGRSMPERFATRRALFDYMRSDRGAAMEHAYQRFDANPSLSSFLAYLEVGQSDHVKAVRSRSRIPADPEVAHINLTALEALFGGLAAAATPTLVLLMPENPLLREDAGRNYHRADLSRREAGRIQALSERHGIPVLDARAWLPAASFLDLDHVMPDIGGLERRLAPELWRALRS
jgi:hypothetical protein